MTVIDFQEYKINKILKNINRLNTEQIKDVLSVLLAEYSSNQAIPIVKLSQKFGIKVYKSSLDAGVGAKILINNKLKETYGSNIIFQVNEKYPKDIQRFAVARELSYYLFNVLQRTTITKHTVIEEAYYLYKKDDEYKDIAMSILMPDSSFCDNFLFASKTRNWNFTEDYLSKLYKVPRSIVKEKIKKL